MTALAYLRTHGLEAEALPDGALRVSPPERITSDIRSWVRLHKAELLAELAAQPSIDQHGPTALHHCGYGTFHQAEPDGPWLCSICHPRTQTPVAVLTVSGGRIPGYPRELGTTVYGVRVYRED